MLNIQLQQNSLNLQSDTEFCVTRMWAFYKDLNSDFVYLFLADFVLFLKIYINLTHHNVLFSTDVARRIEFDGH